jgi:hypothetical protein
VDDKQSATLVIRAWLENGDAFRARLTSVRTPSRGAAEEDAAVTAVASAEQLIDAVRRWLDEVTRGT